MYIYIITIIIIITINIYIYTYVYKSLDLPSTAFFLPAHLDPSIRPRAQHRALRAEGDGHHVAKPQVHGSNLVMTGIHG